MDGIRGNVLEIKDMIAQLEIELEKTEDKKNKILLSIESLKQLEPNENLKNVVRNYIKNPKDNKKNTKISLKTRKNQKFTDKQEEKICKMYEKGFTLKEIKEKFSLSADPQIYAILKRHNVTIGRKGKAKIKPSTDYKKFNKEAIIKLDLFRKENNIKKYDKLIAHLRENEKFAIDMGFFRNKDNHLELPSKRTFNYYLKNYEEKLGEEENICCPECKSKNVNKAGWRKTKNKGDVQKRNPKKLLVGVTEEISQSKLNYILKHNTIPIHLIESNIIEKYGSRIKSENIKRILYNAGYIAKTKDVGRPPKEEEDMDEMAGITLDDIEEI